MTTPYAAKLYLAQHLKEHEGQKYAVFNPQNKPTEELPLIIGFNNGGSPEFLSAVALAEDGTCLGGHCCSHEGYMRHDLGIYEGTREDMHKESYQKHYPNGYRMTFIESYNISTDETLQKAFKLNEKQRELSASSDAQTDTQTASAPKEDGDASKQTSSLNTKE